MDHAWLGVDPLYDGLPLADADGLMDRLRHNLSVENVEQSASGVGAFEMKSKAPVDESWIELPGHSGPTASRSSRPT